MKGGAHHTRILFFHSRGSCSKIGVMIKPALFLSLVLAASLPGPVAATPLLPREDSRSGIRRNIQPGELPDIAGASGQSAARCAAYLRKPENAAKFAKAQRARAEEDYKAAARLLREIVAADERDYEAWQELGATLLIRKDYKAADIASRKALQLNPECAFAMLNLGKLNLLRRDFEDAVEVLARLVEKQPGLAEAQYHLGEAYLQVRKGSKAIVHFNEAIRLDPIGMADGHLRLAELYHAAGFRDRAVAEYEKFLAKKPDYPGENKLRKYIRENKKLGPS